MRKLLWPMVLTFGLLLSSTLAAPAMAAGEHEMTVEQAGEYYLLSICKTSPAIDRFNKRIWRGKDTITRAEVARRLPAIRRESARLGAALYREAQRLDSPPAGWPTTVTSPLDSMVSNDVRESDLRYDAGSASSAGEWLRLSRRANDAFDPHLDTKVRFKLGLPPRGEGC